MHVLYVVSYGAVENLQDYGMDSPWHVVDRLEKSLPSDKRRQDVYVPMTDVRMRRSGGGGGGDVTTMTDIRMKKEGWVAELLS